MTHAQLSLKRAIQARARELGFDQMGVTSPDQPPHFDFFERWLEAERHGEMAYLATQRAHQCRADPRQILSSCHSIIVLGMRYPTPHIPADGESYRQGRVASYAWGQDYHLVIGDRLQSLVRFIERWLGKNIASRWYTDTGPVLERDLAQQAGLGWAGKNTCLINPRLGSYSFLAVILLDIDLEPDRPFLPDRCGECTRCIQACPTGAILPDRSLDARRCIAYLTIELKGAIPAALRPLMGNWVFGCDICQQVCPWNRRSALSEWEPVYDPRPQLPFSDLVQELTLSPAEFNQKFYRNPIRRTKRRGYLRNVAVALANQAKMNPQLLSTAVVALSHALLSEAEPLIRGHAAWGLAQLDDRAARQALCKAMDIEKDSYVLSELQSCF